MSTTSCAASSSDRLPDDPFLAGILDAAASALGWHLDDDTYPTPGTLAKALWAGTVQTPALDLIDQALVDVAAGRCKRLIISMPPQEGKSERASHYFPLWLLRRNHDLRIAIVSYEQRIAERWGRVIRGDAVTFDGRDGNIDLGMRIAPDNGAVSDWKLDRRRGGVYCTGIGGALTGRPVDVLVIDDPFKDEKAARSEVQRENVWTWWQSVGMTRLAPGAPVVLIMTRWHEDDLAGRLQREHPGEWRVLNIPALADHDPANGERDVLGREPGEFMRSARRRTGEQWQRIKREAGSRVWNALYQGRPSPDEGDVWQRSWWRYYTEPLWDASNGVCVARGMDEVIQSWDMTFKDTAGTDFVVGGVWGRRGSQMYLLDLVRKRMAFPATVAAVERLSSKWPQATAKLIEDKANGPAVIATLAGKVGGLIPYSPRDSKYGRAAAVAPFIEAGDVYLPDPAVCPWVTEFVDECAAFPNGAHDDQVDMTSQAGIRLLLPRRHGRRMSHGGRAT